MKNELFERELQNTSINDVSLADYVKENYLPISVLDKIRAEIEQAAFRQFRIAMGVLDSNERYAHVRMENAYKHSLNVIDKYKSESEDKE